jgi:hypothetical protein
MATINHKTYNEGTETFKDFSVYDGKDTLIFKVDGSAQSAAVTGTLAVSGNATFDTDYSCGRCCIKRGWNWYCFTAKYFPHWSKCPC